MPAYESPFHAILDTNSVPTDAECGHIRDFLAPHQAKLVELDAEVERLRVQLDATTSERDKLGNFVAAHHALLSPMRRIPEDILRLIFLKTLPERRNTAMHPSEGPLLLASVCRYWQDLVMATPQLWSTIHVVVARFPPIPPGWVGALPQQWYVAPRLATFLARGGHAPLDITMQVSRQPLAESAVDAADSSGVPGSGPSPFLRALMGASGRWRKMKLWMLSNEDTQALAGLRASDVPQLESFDLMSFAETPRLNFLGTPSLRHLSIQGNYPSFPPDVYWQNLVSLDIQVSSTSAPQMELIEFPFPFLAHCASLEKLAVTISGYGFLPTPDGDCSILLPQLKLLDLGFFDAGNMSTAIHMLDVPRLHTFNVSRGLTVVPDIFDRLDHIRCLVLTLDYLTTDLLVSVLRLVPVLERLRLIGEPIPPAAPTAAPGFAFASKDHRYLTRLLPSDPVPLCPALRHLELTFVQLTPDALMVDLVHARTTALPAADPPVARLTAFSCFLLREPQLDMAAALADCAAAGLVIRVAQRPVPVPVPETPQYSALEGTESDAIYRPGGPAAGGLDGAAWLVEL
ncbi:F-box domain-containing protein [Mycena indigotica]|uniref:F-box domain-containing protein n=1 Tax=Mycena indigotica TaxID=2126181 RepID=A0A8H6RXC5_9AGAR|nr:F-box domain-containing protein [Mycena indigotica]KAF7288628.1 F-box domain-containing protein [Mycena indigotica]